MTTNIPIKYTDNILLEELDEFDGKFDCLDISYDFEKKGNRGYAFINFTHPLHILLFYEKFNNKSWTHFESKNICELNLANFQGINEIQKHAKNYKGIKRLKFYFELDPMIPSKYLSKLQLTYLHTKQDGLIHIKSLHDSTNNSNNKFKKFIIFHIL